MADLGQFDDAEKRKVVKKLEVDIARMNATKEEQEYRLMEMSVEQERIAKSIGQMTVALSENRTRPEELKKEYSL